MKLKRSDKQYIEVEDFADYEITQCIAYEMAARDWHYRDIADGVVNFYNHHKQSIEFYMQYKDDHSVEFEAIQEGSENANELHSLISEINLVKIEDIPQEYQDPRLGSKFWEIYQKLYSFWDIEEGGRDPKIETISENIWITNTIKRDGYEIETSLSAVEDECNIPIDQNDEDGEYKIAETIDEFHQCFTGDGAWGVDSSITIREKYKRPTIQIDGLKTLDTMLTVNLNKPLNEIIAFIQHVKNDMEKNKLFKSPLEILGTELGRADNLVCNDNGEKCFDPRSILSKQQKMADMFYIYDCLKLGYSQRKIQNEVYNYYADKGLNITLDPGTLRKYRDIAMEYIVEGKYKEMLTGIKVDEFNYQFG